VLPDKSDLTSGLCRVSYSWATPILAVGLFVSHSDAERLDVRPFANEGGLYPDAVGNRKLPARNRTLSPSASFWSLTIIPRFPGSTFLHTF
jgi:hypothetical protein